MDFRCNEIQNDNFDMMIRLEQVLSKLPVIKKEDDWLKQQEK